MCFLFSKRRKDVRLFEVSTVQVRSFSTCERGALVCFSCSHLNMKQTCIMAIPDLQSLLLSLTVCLAVCIQELAQTAGLWESFILN